LPVPAREADQTILPGERKKKVRLAGVSAISSEEKEKSYETWFFLSAALPKERRGDPWQRGEGDETGPTRPHLQKWKKKQRELGKNA